MSAFKITGKNNKIAYNGLDIEEKNGDIWINGKKLNDDKTGYTTGLSLISVSIISFVLGALCAGIITLFN